MNKNQHDMISVIFWVVGFMLFFGVWMTLGCLVPWKRWRQNVPKVLAIVGACVVTTVVYLIGVYLWLGVTPP